MAKKRRPRDKQTQMKGDGFDTNQASANLEKLAEQYTEALYNRREWQDTENELRPQLAALMAGEGVALIELDDCTVTYKHIEEDKVSVKKRKDEDEE